MNNTLAVTLLSSCALLLGACTTGMEEPQPMVGSEFTRALNGQYRELDAQRDKSVSEHFRGKALAAGRGEAVQPDDVIQNDSPQLETELATARAGLVAALDRGIAARAPAAAARAQAAFDCWNRKGIGSAKNGSLNCRDSYYWAMMEVNGTPAAAPVAATPQPVTVVR